MIPSHRAADTERGQAQSLRSETNNKGRDNQTMKISKIMALAAAFSAAMPLMADTEMVNGYTWTYRINGDTAEIGKGSSKAISPDPTGAVTIPSTLGGKPVTSIGEDAFNNCNWMSSVTIPNGVTKIGKFAFVSCNALTNISIPPSVTTIGAYAFSGDRLTNINIYISDLAAWSKVTIVRGWMPEDGIGAYNLYLNGQNVSKAAIPSGTWLIGSRLFASCMSLTSVTLPNSVTHIEEYAFVDCHNLNSVTIPRSVEYIGEYAFMNCYALRNVTIPNADVKREAFVHCNQLASVTLGDGVTSIGEAAFFMCRSLKSITVPRNVEYIGEGAFEGCGKLTKITLPMWCKNTYVYYNNREWRLTEEKIPGFELSTWQAYLGLSSKAKITYKDVRVAVGGTASEAWQTARTLKGVAYRHDDGTMMGVIELKCGKANKKGVAKVSATLTGLDGKKKNYKYQSVDVTEDEDEEEEVEISFDGLSIWISGEDGSFYGEGDLNGKFYVEIAKIGGNWTRTDAGVYMDMTSAPPSGTVEDLLPDGESVIAKGGKWAFNKAATVKLSKDKTKAEWDTSKGKTNLSSMKLTYTPKTGLFKGSFKVYALEDTSGGKKKLKKYTANVTGVVVDGTGYGQATIKKPAVGPWTVVVE